MFSAKEIQLEKIIVHKIGNPVKDEELVLSDETIMPSEEIGMLLKKYFLSSFKEHEFYQFNHPTQLMMNEVYHYVSRVFDGEDCFEEAGESLAKLLYSKTDHPAIKSGEFYFVQFSNIQFQDQSINGIGIFKSETKDVYLKVEKNKKGFSIGSEEGINIKKLDKGCLVLDFDQENGYRVCVVDKVNNKERARFWQNDFLSVRPYSDAYGQTSNYMEMTREFIRDVCTQDNEFPQEQQVDLIHKSVEFFNKEKEFDQSKFIEEVLPEQPDVNELFKEYKDAWAEEKQMPLENNFEIEEQAFVKAKSKYKHVMKLDGNFDVYIHGSKEYLEKGFDKERNMNYYKLYFESEE